MNKMRFTVTINSPAEKVWDVMLRHDSFRIWAAEFMPGSYYEGSWHKGDRIRFLTPDGDGMSAEIAEERKNEFISIRHLGLINNGIEDTESPEVRKWAPAYENYTFIERDGSTEVIIDMDVIDDYIQFMETAWPKALAVLKTICEKTPGV